MVREGGLAEAQGPVSGSDDQAATAMDPELDDIVGAASDAGVDPEHHSVHGCLAFERVDVRLRVAHVDDVVPVDDGRIPGTIPKLRVPDLHAQLQVDAVEEEFPGKNPIEEEPPRKNPLAEEPYREPL